MDTLTLPNFDRLAHGFFPHIARISVSESCETHLETKFPRLPTANKTANMKDQRNPRHSPFVVQNIVWCRGSSGKPQQQLEDLELQYRASLTGFTPLDGGGNSGIVAKSQW